VFVKHKTDNQSYLMKISTNITNSKADYLYLTELIFVCGGETDNIQMKQKYVVDEVEKSDGERANEAETGWWRVVKGPPPGEPPLRRWVF
jgi:hypothetical protein